MKKSTTASPVGGWSTRRGRIGNFRAYQLSRLERGARKRFISMLNIYLRPLNDSISCIKIYWSFHGQSHEKKLTIAKKGFLFIPFFFRSLLIFPLTSCVIGPNRLIALLIDIYENKQCR